VFGCYEFFYSKDKCCLLILSCQWPRPKFPDFVLKHFLLIFLEWRPYLSVAVSRPVWLNVPQIVKQITKHHISHQQQRNTRTSTTNTTTSPPTVVGRLGPPDPLGLPGTPGPLGVPGQPGTNGAVGPSGPSGVVGGNSLKLWKNLNEKDSHPCITMRSISINLEAIL
jgi:hypothetical protein